MNPRTKGRNAELELKKLLEDAGWYVLLTDMPKRWSKEQDFFSCFDIMAYKGKYRKYIQIKCNRKPPFKPYREWAEKYANEFDSVEVWVRIDHKPKNKRWNSYIIYPEGI